MPVLEEILADEGGVVAGAAAGEDDAIGPPQLLGIEVEAAEMGRGRVGKFAPQLYLLARRGTNSS